MGNIDKYDYELQEHREDLKFGVTLNFKSMMGRLSRLEEETREVTEEYPKSELKKIWLGCMAGIFLFALISYSYIIFVTLPIIFFYVLALRNLFKTWKHFGYKSGYLWKITIPTLVVAVAVAVGLQLLIMG
ncbi:MAG: hypothetical protein MJ114_02115 [Acetatifactor sp.]|nr:hypothetical protein [Acetatifactor sp.]